MPRGTGTMSTVRTKEEHAERKEEHEKEGEEEHGEHDGHQGNEAPVEVTPETVVEILGAPAHPDEEVAGRTARPGVASGLCRTAAGGELSFVEASRMPGSGALTLTGRQGEVMRESARTALSWLRANAGRYGLDPAFHRNSDVHLHVQSGEVAKEGASAGVTLAVALASAFTGRVVRGDLAMTGEITLSGQVLPVGGIKEKVLAAYRHGVARVVLPQQNRKQVDEDLGDDLSTPSPSTSSCSSPMSSLNVPLSAALYPADACSLRWPGGPASPDARPRGLRTPGRPAWSPPAAAATPAPAGRRSA